MHYPTSYHPPRYSVFSSFSLALFELHSPQKCMCIPQMPIVYFMQLQRTCVHHAKSVQRENLVQYVDVHSYQDTKIQMSCKLLSAPLSVGMALALTFSNDRRGAFFRRDRGDHNVGIDWQMVDVGRRHACVAGDLHNRNLLVHWSFGLSLCSQL